MSLLFAQDKISGSETYLVCVETDLSALSYTARRKNCRGITTSLDEAMRKASTLARDESNTCVGVLTLAGEVVATVYAYDLVRKFFYTCPLVAGHDVAIWPHRSNDRYLYTSDNNRHVYTNGDGFPGKVVEHFDAQLHTDKYFENLTDVHA
jgi:hypothetical protein